jgi:hypothetical protein
MKVNWPNIAQFGVIRDRKDFDLPVNAWSDARNVRFRDGAIDRMKGYSEALQGSPIAPYWLMHVFDRGGISHWLVAGLEEVYDYSNGLYSNITKAATVYGANERDKWNGGVLGNIPIINNGFDKPQMWAPVDGTQKLVDLSNWPANHTARVVKPFKNFLFALDVTESGTRFQHRVRVSHPAVPGAVPSSWDDTDPTKDVYVNDLSDFGQGPLLDCYPLRDVNILYKERSCWGMQYVGGRSKWRLFSILEKNGILTTHCATPFLENSMHFVATGQDIITHNGQTPQSVLHARMRQWLLANIDPISYQLSFCCENEQEGECLFCFPLIGSTTVNMALVWNYRDNTVTLRPLDDYTFIAPGQIPQVSSDPWDSDTESWDDDLTPWDQFTHPPHIGRLLGAKPATSKLFHIDFTETADGQSFESYVERTGLDVYGASPEGEPLRSRSIEKLIRRVYIQAEGSPFEVWIAVADKVEGPYSWANQGIFTPGTDEYIDVGLSARLWGIRFRSLGSGNWKIIDFQPDVEPLSEF